jgi:[ribosomal protein S5]-alanine N-acetyltransferase
MELRGETCVLRRWRTNDLASLIRHANNANVSRYLRDRFPCPYTRRDGRAFLASAAGSGSGDTRLAIDVDGEAVGGIGIIIGTDVERYSAEVGYWLGEAYWGRGIVTEALRLFSEDVFDRLNLLRLFAVASSANVGSARVLEKAGYQKEAVMRSAAVKFGEPSDQLLYARINPNWRGVEAETKKRSHG